MSDNKITPITWCCTCGTSLTKDNFCTNPDCVDYNPAMTTGSSITKNDDGSLTLGHLTEESTGKKVIVTTEPKCPKCGIPVDAGFSACVHEGGCPIELLEAIEEAASLCSTFSNETEGDPWAARADIIGKAIDNGTLSSLISHDDNKGRTVEERIADLQDAMIIAQSEESGFPVDINYHIYPEGEAPESFDDKVVINQEHAKVLSDFLESWVSDNEDSENSECPWTQYEFHKLSELSTALLKSKP